MAEAPPPMPDLVDPLLESLREATIGDYEVLAELGRGGMAVVYLAHDLALDRKVAIKVMLPALVQSEGSAERFKREARTAASLTHPNIIPIYAVRHQDVLLYFVMQFVAGRTLDSIIEERGQLPVAMVQDILTQVGDALAYAHRRGVIHRDVKPGNILLDEDGRAIVTDFGIAKVSSAESLTQTGGVVGTPSYMSPEQCTASTVTGASDQYCLGLIGYEMLTGKQPFTGATAVQLMFSRCTEDPPPLEKARPDCPHHITEAITRMLAREAADRWPHMADAVAAVGSPSTGEREPIRQEMATLARTGTSARIFKAMRTPTSPIPAARATSSSPAVPATSTAAVAVPRALLYAFPAVLLLAVAGWVLLRGRAPAPVQAPAPAVAADTSDPAPAPAPAAAVARVRLSPAGAVALEAGGTVQLSATALDASGKPVPDAGIEWGSSDSSVAVVSPAGVVRGTGPGIATLTAQSRGSISATAVTVRGPPAPPPAARQAPARPAASTVAALSLVAPAETLGIGGVIRLRATPEDEAGRALEGQEFFWSSSAPRVASVGEDGTVTAQGAGSATITATTGGVSRSVKLTVLPGAAPAKPAPDTATSAPVAAATPPPAAPPVATAEENRRAIATVLAAFRTAVVSRDITRLRRAYPGMTQPEEQAYRELFQSGGQFDLELASETPDIQGTTAVVTGTAQYHYTEPRKLEQAFSYRAVLDGSSGNWRLTSIVFAQQ